MIYQRQIIAYHGCLKQRFTDALLDGVAPPPSTEKYDWLGSGIYFWEHGPERALEWAEGKAKREGKPRKDARVLGAIIQLGECMDLLDRKATGLLAQAYPAFVDSLPAGTPLPRNQTASDSDDLLLRYLDRAVLEFTIKMLEDATGRRVQTVRGAFWEGGPVFEGAGVQLMSHVQVAVRDTSCIVGYFRP